MSNEGLEQTGFIQGKSYSSSVKLETWPQKQ